MRAEGAVFGVSDLHVGHRENRRIVETLRPSSGGDWLLVGGDISDELADVEWVLRVLTERFATVVWVPGNHELWSAASDPPQLRGAGRYQHLIGVCRHLGVLTPEDPYPIWDGPGGPVVIAPLFVLYDYSFGRNIAATKAQALALAHAAGVVCSDEFVLDPHPYASREAWCHARVRDTERRLDGCDPALGTVLVNHFPLSAEPTRALWHQEFAQWCGTVLTEKWPVRYRASAVVHGHLHIPRTTWHHGVRFEEVSLGYPREWRRQRRSNFLRRILPAVAR